MSCIIRVTLLQTGNIYPYPLNISPYCNIITQCCNKITINTLWLAAINPKSLKNNKKLLKRVKNSKNIPGLHTGTGTPPVAPRPRKLGFFLCNFREFVTFDTTKPQLIPLYFPRVVRVCAWGIGYTLFLEFVGVAWAYHINAHKPPPHTRISNAANALGIIAGKKKAPELGP